MSRRALLGFIGLNILVTFLVTSAIILVSEARRAPAPTPPGNLLRVVITATLDPLQTPQVRYIVVTATPPGQPTGIVILPTPGPGTTVATLDPALLPPEIGTPLVPSATAEGGCPTYALQQGDTLGKIAAAYSVSLADLRRANSLKESDDTKLQIGQVLIIPVAGCAFSTDTPEPSITPTFTDTPTPPPSSTPRPTAAEALIEISQVISPGDITAEGTEIRNVSGGTVEIGGWTLRDRSGNVYTFPNYQLYEGRRVIVYTRQGNDTALALFWGLPQAIWGDAEQRITLSDSDGKIQLTFTLADQRQNPVPTPTATP